MGLPALGRQEPNRRREYGFCGEEGDDGLAVFPATVPVDLVSELERSTELRDRRMVGDNHARSRICLEKIPRCSFGRFRTTFFLADGVSV